MTELPHFLARKQREMARKGAEHIAMFLCRQAGLSSREIGKYFSVDKRQVNRVISGFKDKFPEVNRAFEIFNSITKSWANSSNEEDVQNDESCEPVRIESETCADRCRRHNVEKRVQASVLKSVKAKLKAANIQVIRLKARIEALKEGSSCDEIEPPPVDSNEGNNSILEELFRLSEKNPRGRRYSERLLCSSYCLMTYSPRAYNYLRKILPFPSKSQLYQRFSATVSEVKQSLTDPNYTYRLLEAFTAAHAHETEKMVCTLAVDAFAFRVFLRQVAPLSQVRQALTVAQVTKIITFLEDKSLVEFIEGEPSEEDTEDDIFHDQHQLNKLDELFDTYTSCFIFVLIPLNNDIPCLTLHLAPATSGSANGKIIQTLKSLIELCSLYNIDVAYISADGDGAWNAKFHDMFTVMDSIKYTEIDSFSLDVYNKCREENVPLPVTDLLHYLKGARSRYIDKNIVITSHDLSVTTNSEEANKILELNMVLSDKSQIGRMRDFYAVELFQISNVRILLEKEHYADAFYYLPHAILLLVIRVPFFTFNFRMRLLSVAYLLFNEVYLDITRETPKDVEKVPQRRSKDSDIVTWGEPVTLKRILCTITAFASAFLLHRSNMRTDALGTHIVEGKIGQSRRTQDNRWQRILSSFAQGALRSLFQEKEGISIAVPGRLKTAGCRIHNDGDWEIEGFDHVLFSQLMFHSVTEAGRTASDFQTNWPQAIAWISMLETITKERKGEIGQLWMPNPAANSAIMARLLSSKISTSIDQE